MPEDSVEVLAWDGLASCVENLRTALEGWSRQERLRAWGRQSDAAQAQQDAAAISSALRKAGHKEDPWEESLSTLMNDVKEQRDELLKVVETLRKHGTKLLKEDSDLADKIPKEDDLSPEELPSFVIQFLEQIAVEEAKPKAKEKKSQDTKDDEKKSKSTEAEDDEEKSKEDEKKRSRKEDKSIKTNEDRKKRPRKSGKDEGGSKGSEDAYSDYSGSASVSPTPRRRRRRRRRHHRGRRHGKRRRRRSSRSESYSPSRRRRRRKHRRRREDKEKLNVTAEIDRFVRVNKLEDRCEKVLRDLEPQLAYKVMGLSGGGNTFELSGDVRDPTAVVMARVRKAQFARDVGAARR